LSSSAGIEETLHRLGRLMYERNSAFADEFVSDALLVGSEPGEVARGREAVRALIATFHALPARFTWEWERIDSSVHGDTAWFFAEGHVVKEEPSGECTQRPYRLSGVLRAEGSHWLWCFFHGSEPKVLA
jgi:ketosteroid isomerase-like protein